MEQVIFISIFSGLATGIGGLIVIWFGNPNHKILSFYLGISAGMMGMVVLVDLIPSSIQYGSLLHTLIGLFIGIFMMVVFDFLLKWIAKPNQERKRHRYVNEKRIYRDMGYFMTFAIALHNIPEGLAIGAGFESQEALGIRVALIIALHNIPEGLGVASTLYLGQLSRRVVFLLPFATGLFIPLGTIFSAMVSHMVSDWISIGLSMAGGAMGYLVIKEVGPESIKNNPLIGKLGMTVGILILYFVYRIH